MQTLLNHPLRAAIGILGLLSAAATAHPDHDGTEDSPALLLVQADTPPPGAPHAEAAGAARNSVSITTKDGYRLIQSNGWPDHAPGTFPRRGNPNSPTPQSYSFRVPLQPRVSESPEHRGGWWWGVALNGVPFEPGTAETWNNDRQSGWRYEAATGFLNLGLDEHNAHVQPNGSYHYHALPTGLVAGLGGDDTVMRLIGWAADGFPIYTGRAHADPKDAKSELRKMKSGYHLKQGARPTQENGPGGNYDGRFTQDFEYIKDSGDLDECNGRVGVTPEFPNGTYYYCIIAEFPFVPRAWRGTPDPSFSKGERPPGTGLRAAPVGGAPRGILQDGAPKAATSFPPNPPVLKALDLNTDNIVDPLEISKATESLKTLDKNADGKLTTDEYRLPPSGIR